MFLTYPALSEHPKLSTHQCDWLNGLSWLTSWQNRWRIGASTTSDFSVWRTSTDRISLSKNHGGAGFRRMLVSKFRLENCDWRVSTGKIWVDFLCFISCVFWWNFGFFCFWLFDQRSTNPADIPFLLTGAQGEVASSLLCRIFVPKKWDFSPFSVLLSKLSCPACLSKLNDSNLLTSQRDSSTSQSTSAAFSASSTSSRFGTQIRNDSLETSPKNKALSI